MRPFTLPLEVFFSSIFMNVSVPRKRGRIDDQVRTNKFTIVWKALQHPNSMSTLKFGSKLNFWVKFEIRSPFGVYFNITCSKHVPTSFNTNVALLQITSFHYSKYHYEYITQVFKNHSIINITSLLTTRFLLPSTQFLRLTLALGFYTKKISDASCFLWILNFRRPPPRTARPWAGTESITVPTSV